MQEFEIILITFTSIFLFFNQTIKAKVPRIYALGFLSIILILHLFLEGYRWQMIPVYLIWTIAFFTAVRESSQGRSSWLRIFKGIGLGILLFLGIALPFVFPVFELPENTGAYKVGTRDIFLELDREEIITPEAIDKRKIMVKAWYPVTEMTSEEDLYIDKAGRTGFAQKYGLPAFMFNYLDKIETRVYRDAEVAQESFPVLVFSHGYNSKANGYYALLSEIVSHGYIVFALNHTYESTGTTFPNGKMAFFDYSFANKIESNTWHQMEPVIEALNSELSFEQRHPIVQKGLTTYFVKDIVDRWSSDILDVVDKLADWNRNGAFKGNLDLDKIGVFGHSRGGGAAGHAMLKLDKIKAGINIDGVQWGEIVNTKFEDPFLFISADWPEDHEDLNQHAYVNRSSSVFYEALVHKTAHSNFMDIPFMIPVTNLSQAGEIDPYLGMEITNKLVVTFFDKHLKNKDLDLKRLTTEYEMLDLQIFREDGLLSEAE